MQNRSILNSILIIGGLIAATTGAYLFSRFFMNADSSEPVLRFSTSFVESEATPIPLSVPEPKIVAELQGRIRSFAISPNGKTIAIATSNGVALYDLESYKEVRILDEKENSYSVTWSPEGEELAVGSLMMQSAEVGKPQIRVWDTSNWKVVFKPQLGDIDATMFLGAIAWSPNGKFLSTSDYERGLVTLEVKTGRTISLQRDFLLPPYDIAWSPNGSRVVATGDLGYGFRRWRIDTDESVRLYDKRVAAFAAQLAWSPDGKQIASVHADGTVCIWTASTNQCDGYIKAHLDRALSLAWAPDGTQLATGGGVIRIWDTHAGKLIRSFGLNENHLYVQLKWLPNGTLVSLEAGYAESESTIIRFWNVETGSDLLMFRGARSIYGE